MSRAFELAVGIFGIVGIILLVGYYGFRALQRSDESAGVLKVRMLVTVLLVGIVFFMLCGTPTPGWPLIAALFGLILTKIWGRLLISELAQPFLSIFNGGDEPPEPKPFYSIAEAKRQRGFHQEALQEIEKQLEKFPNDFTGTMMVATIHAEDLKDLPRALQIIDDLLTLPNQPPQLVAGALQLVADWQLRFSQDPKAARVTFERLMALLPDTQWAHMAQQRIARLPTVEGMTAMKDRVINLPQGRRDIGLELKSPEADNEPTPAQTADIYLKRLELFPSDNDAREKLLMIYAEHFHRVDLAAEQLEQLISQPHQTPKRVAYWLNLLATIYLQHGGSLEAAEAAMRRIICAFPGQAPAELAFTRLASLRTELKVNRINIPKKLGVYEQDMGLRSKGSKGV